MPPRAHRPDQLRGTFFRGTWAVRHGLLTPDQLRCAAWRRLFRDVYACRTLAVDHCLRARAAALLVLPGAVVTGRSAAALWGLDAVDDAAVELTVPARAPVTAARGVRMRRRDLPPASVTRHRGAAVTTPEHTALDLARDLPLEDAVVLVDRLVVAGRADLARVRRLAAEATGRGCRRARAAVERADGLAESPQETRLRLLLHSSGLPRPVAQHVIRHAGRFVARVDFAWPEHRVALEYDGAWHGEPAQFRRDRQRLNQLTAAGWRVLFVTAADLRDPVGLVRRIRVVLADAR